MKSKFARPAYQFIVTTQFWKDNALVLKGLKHSRYALAFALIFSVLTAICSALSVGCIASFLQGLTNPNDPPLQTGIQLIDVWLLGTEAEVTSRIYRVAFLLLSTVCLQFVFLYLSRIYTKNAILELTNNLRKQLFEQLVSVNIEFYSTTRTGALISTIRGEVNQVSRALELISGAFTQSLMLISYLGAMFYISWQLSLVSLLVFILMSVCISTLTKRVRALSFEVTAANKNFASTTLELINGIRTVNASGTQAFERRRFYAAADKVHRTTEKTQRLGIAVGPLVQGFSTAMVVLMTATAFNWLVSGGQLQATALIAFLFALTRMGPLVSQLNNAWTQFNGLQGALGSVADLLKRSDKPYIIDGKVEFSGLKQAIELVDVHFSYRSDEEKVLTGINLSIRQGETTALVGESGAGKSTLADIVARFHDPTAGKILLDGVDLREFRINSIREQMSIVSQDTFIFNASARENIAYGVDGVDDSSIFEAAVRANAIDFIRELPMGFETSLGNRGVRLSGGQRQRIAIARALLRNPDILILDEATSALDSVTERLIQESIEQLSKGRTVIAIAHRLSTISKADKVVVLERGKIIEQGEYKTLIERRGKLWQYHAVQYSVESSA
ncbi:MAG: heterocyst formation ABC transporter subunit HepA [Cyanobacteria bacterium J06650_10]